ncbi:MAG TPA: O-antigen ligase family protein [Sphingobium sp.]|uniref:O-antigen ligase family protein n=1 Tax=Sphingobium sp. TaxID=1912891 RepID=UPI002ED4BB1C
MRTRNLLIPAFLFFLPMIARLVWSPIDSESASYTFQSLDGGFLTGKVAVGLAFLLLAPFLLYIKRPIQMLGIFPLILYGFAAASLAWTYDIGTTVYTLTLLTCVFGYALAMNALWGTERTLLVLWLFASAVIAVSIGLALLDNQYALMAGLHQGAWRGLFAHKNAFGPFLVAHIFLTIFGRSYIRLPLVIALLIAAVDVYALVYTRSGTAVVAAVAGLAAGMVFIPIRHSGLRFLWRLGAALVLLASLSVVVFNVDQVFDLLGRDSTLTGRAQLWEQAYSMVSDHRLGTGYGTSGGSQVSIELQKITKRHDSLGVQSGYLNMALELGWIAVGIFVFWLVSAIATSFFSVRASPAQALFVALAVQHLVGSYSESFGCLFPSWSLTLLVTALIAMRGSVGIRWRSTRRSRKTVAAPA